MKIYRFAMMFVGRLLAASLIARSTEALGKTLEIYSNSLSHHLTRDSIYNCILIPSLQSPITTNA